MGMLTPHPPVFLANRIDGLGARLTAVRNAIALADHFGGRVAIGWMDRKGEHSVHHAIERIDETFSPSFISDTFIDPGVASAAIRFDEFFRRFSSNDLSTTAAVIAPIYFSGQCRAEMQRRLPPASLAAAFRKIGFSDQIEAAMAAADDLPIRLPAIALHLRAGDIIYGVFRKFDAFTNKVVPFQVASQLAREIGATGRTVLIFGQDNILCEAVAEATGAVWASSLLPPEYTQEPMRAMFEVALMSRCEGIFAGSSHFAELAEARSGVPLLQANAAVTLEQARHIILDRPEDESILTAASPLQRAFSYWWLANRMLSAQSPERGTILECVRQARSHDPENPFYDLVLARLLWEQGSSGEAEQVFDDASLDHLKGVYALLRNENLPLKNHRLAFATAAASGSPWASACLAVELDNNSNAMKPEWARHALGRISHLPDDWREHLETVGAGCIVPDGPRMRGQP